MRSTAGRCSAGSRPTRRPTPRGGCWPWSGCRSGRLLRPAVSGGCMQVDFVNVSTEGLESSPVAEALAGLRANEARYYKNKYDHVFTVHPASEDPETLAWLNRILKDERDIVFSARPLEATSF